MSVANKPSKHSQLVSFIGLGLPHSPTVSCHHMVPGSNPDHSNYALLLRKNWENNELSSNK